MCHALQSKITLIYSGIVYGGGSGSIGNLGDTNFLSETLPNGGAWEVQAEAVGELSAIRKLQSFCAKFWVVRDPLVVVWLKQQLDELLAA
jgi:hypothetical protein